MRSTRTPTPKSVKKAVTPKSGKQRRVEIRTRRQKKAEQLVAPRFDPRILRPGANTAPCNSALLAPYNSYGLPIFVSRGFYEDAPFACIDCGKQELWTATQQKWWYEIAKGNVESIARRCRACRRKERERSAEARRVHLEGLELRKLRGPPPAKVPRPVRLKR